MHLTRKYHMKSLLYRLLRKTYTECYCAVREDPTEFPADHKYAVIIAHRGKVGVVLYEDRVNCYRRVFNRNPHNMILFKSLPEARAYLTYLGLVERLQDGLTLVHGYYGFVKDRWPHMHLAELRKSLNGDPVIKA